MHKIYTRLAKLAVTGSVFTCAAILVEPDKRFPLFSSVNAKANLIQQDLRKDCKPFDLNWDGMSNEKSNIVATRHLFFIRHGQYNYANDDADCKLTLKGHKQTELTGIRLKKLELPYSKIIYSTMTRAKESMEEIHRSLQNVPIESDDGIREGAVFPPDPPVPNWPNSESDFDNDGERIENAFRKHMHRADPGQKEDSYEIYVCHSNVIRYFVCRLLQIPPNAWIRMTLDHGSITYVTIRPSGITSLKWLGNSGFIPKEYITVS